MYSTCRQVDGDYLFDIYSEDNDALYEAIAEHGAARRVVYRCSDSACGAEDCAACFPLSASAVYKAFYSTNGEPDET